MTKIITEQIKNYALSEKEHTKTLFSHVGVIGCGNVGQDICRMMSKHDIEVVFIEISEEKVKRSFKRISQKLDAMIDRWGMTEGEKKVILSRIQGYTDIKYLKNCDLVIETITAGSSKEDKIQIQKEIFKSLEQYVDKSTIFATNSATISITELSSALKYKERCINLHFISTSPDAGIIEVIRGYYTSDEVYKKIEAFVRMIKKQLIPVDESPGLVSIRLLITLINEACEMLMEGVSSMENIDTTMRIGFGLPHGPFEMADKIGLDKILRWMDNIYKEFGDTRYKASPVIKKLVRAHRFGKDAGRGFYTYN